MYVSAAYGTMLLRVDVDVRAPALNEHADNEFLEWLDHPVRYRRQTG
jgi:hypothetical protein